MTLGDWAGTVWVTWKTQEEYAKECIVPTFKQSNLYMMVQGCIKMGKKGSLVVLEYLGGR